MIRTKKRSTTIKLMIAGRFRVLPLALRIQVTLNAFKAANTAWYYTGYLPIVAPRSYSAVYPFPLAPIRGLSSSGIWLTHLIIAVLFI
ncbi:hypothetical protein [Lacticaseibacillus pantheris]|uniref:hypothetical protein n=1 Tax=Lacticaseibacillus pantheris TaxID=171523 RepID=UPI00265AD5C3|nr:hypothetical protein [Lacticaseibacillus pantheris]WKF84099.1 hypothetical protein QY874_07305 [Lacticaseibacillus pantheris]